MTRAEIQAYIDGHLKAGGDPSTIKDNLMDWMDKHPLYPQSKAAQATIASDLESYRSVPKTVVPVEDVIDSPTGGAPQP